MSVDYIERSASIAQALDAEAINDTPLGEIVDENSTAATYALGSTALGGETLHLGVQVARHPRLNASMLFSNRLIWTAHFLETQPEFLPNVPAFTAGLVYEGGVSSWQSAVLVEDITQGGRLKPQPMSDAMQEEFERFRGRTEDPPVSFRDPDTGVERTFRLPDILMTFGIRDRIADRFRWETGDRLSVAFKKDFRLASDLKARGERI